MVSFFAPPTGDLSVGYLNHMFGSMDGVLAGTTQTTVIGALFQTINTTALVLGSLIVLHTVVMGLLKTATEGEFLGKQWSSIWVPFRTIMGVAALFPSISGYSILQVILMWVVVQGIGAADTLWTTVMDYLSLNKSPYATTAAGVTPALTPTGGVSPSTISIPTAMGNLFNALVCQATLYRSDPDTYASTSNGNSTLYYCNANPNDPFCSKKPEDLININATPPVSGIVTYSMGPSGVCGTMKFPDPKTYIAPKGTAPVCSLTDAASVITCAGITQQVTTLSSVVSTGYNMAQTIAAYDHEYIQFYDGITPVPPPPIPTLPTPDWINAYCTASGIPPISCCIQSAAASPLCYKASDNKFPTPYYNSNNVTDWTNASTGQGGAGSLYWTYALLANLGNLANVPAIMATKYIGDITGAVASASTGTANLTGWMANSAAGGWITAGSYYYTIASMSNSITTAAMPPLAINATDPATVGGLPAGYRNDFKTAADILTAINQSSQSTISNTPPAMQQQSSAVNAASGAILSSFQSTLTGGGLASNPLVAAQAFGESLLISAQVAYPILLILSSVALAATSIDAMVLGTGLTIDPALPVAEFVIKVAWGMFMLFCGWAFTFGGMLAIYLPMVPYFIFTFGTIGWFIAVFESMAAGPFVALGILSPNAQHEWLGKAEPAIMILLNIFLRPTLMIFGMMAAMILAPVVVTMINAGFMGVVGSIYGGTALGPIEEFLFISAYATLIVTAMNKCFALVYMMPERVLTWIGGQPISYGEAEGLGAVKGAVDAAGAAVKGGAESGGQQAHASAERGGKKRGELNEKARQSEAAAKEPKIGGS